MKSRDWDSEGGLNLTPLLDVILNLLFFFILATQIKENREYIDIDLPKSEQVKQVAEKKDFIIINIDKDNIIYIDGNKVDLEKLPDILKEKKSNENIQKVIIRGDAITHNQTIVSTLDKCSLANMTSISLEVTQK